MGGFQLYCILGHSLNHTFLVYKFTNNISNTYCYIFSVETMADLENMVRSQHWLKYRHSNTLYNIHAIMLQMFTGFFLCCSERSSSENHLFVSWAACINDVIVRRLNGLSEMHNIVQQLDKFLLYGRDCTNSKTDSIIIEDVEIRKEQQRDIEGTILLCPQKVSGPSIFYYIY